MVTTPLSLKIPCLASLLIQFETPTTVNDLMLLNNFFLSDNTFAVGSKNQLGTSFFIKGQSPHESLNLSHLAT